MDFKHTDTNLEIENEYPKLVRDLIPEIIEKRHGEKPQMKIAESDEEFRDYLLTKVVEEAVELKETKNKEHLVEELADVIELIDAVLKFENLNLEDIRKVQEQKREKRGGFEDRIIMLKKV